MRDYNCDNDRLPSMFKSRQSKSKMFKLKIYILSQAPQARFLKITFVRTCACMCIRVCVCVCPRRHLVVCCRPVVF